MDCIFCKILNGDIPSERIYEDKKFILIRDINPQAKVHYLAVPKFHEKYIKNIPSSKLKVVTHILSTVDSMQDKLGLSGGYRVMINQGDDANQTVPHLHIHFLGGEKLKD